MEIDAYMYVHLCIHPPAASQLSHIDDMFLPNVARDVDMNMNGVYTPMTVYTHDGVYAVRTLQYMYSTVYMCVQLRCNGIVNPIRMYKMYAQPCFQMSCVH